MDNRTTRKKRRRQRGCHSTLADDNGVVTAHWRVSAEDGDYSASSYGTCGFTPDPTSDDFVPFEDLTEAMVIEWVKGSLDVDAIEARRVQPRRFER